MAAISKARALVKLPAYSVPDAALYLGVAASTARWWAFGRVLEGKRYEPMIEVADRKRRLLSFENLVELHVLSAIRSRGVPLQGLREAVLYLRKQFNSEHPLATEEMFTSGATLLVGRLEGDIEVSGNVGQATMTTVVRQYLQRVVREHHIPMRLYPFLSARHRTDGETPDANKPVMIDPRVQYGRPVLSGTGVATAELVDRWRGGESIDALAKDFERPKTVIEEAIRYATARARAA